MQWLKKEKATEFGSSALSLIKPLPPKNKGATTSTLDRCQMRCIYTKPSYKADKLLHGGEKNEQKALLHNSTEEQLHRIYFMSRDTLELLQVLLDNL